MKEAPKKPSKDATKKVVKVTSIKKNKTKCSAKLVQAALIAAKGCKSKVAKALGCSRVTLDKYIKRWPKLAEVQYEITEANMDDLEAKALKMAKAGDRAMLIFMLRNLGKGRGYVDAKPEAIRREMSSEAASLIERLSEGEITATYAALQFTALGLEVPDSIRLIMAKEVPETPDPTNGEFSPTTEEEMMARVEQRKKEMGVQRDGLPEREAEIQQLKEEMKDADSFNPSRMESNGKAT